MSGIPFQGFSGVVGEVDPQRNMQVKLPDTTVPANVGGVRIFSENDAGDYTGTPDLLSPETDDDYRFRASLDTILDSETFSYTAQNTGKHIYSNTTMTTTWTAGQMTTNGSSITTTTTAVNVSTKAFFPLFGAAPLYVETTLAFTAQATTNTYIRFGMFLNGGGTAYTPTDGVFFELGPSGLNCYIVNNTGTPVAATITTPFTHDNTTRYKFTITITERLVSFWIDDVLYAQIACPIAQGQPFMAAALPWAISHTIIGGAAGSVIQALVSDYTISIGGYNLAAPPELTMNAMFGSYQGLSGGTMGSLASYANSANPTAAVPTNTTSTVLTALGGQGWETDTLAVTTDGIIMSYQVPAGTVNVLGKRLVVYGVRISSYIQTALTGGGYNAQFCLAFGHTAVSLATAEAATTKAPRRVALDSYSVVAAAAVLAQLPLIDVKFKCPIVVNPGEFIAIVKKKIGTAPSAGVVAYTFLLDYHWL